MLALEIQATIVNGVELTNQNKGHVVDFGNDIASCRIGSGNAGKRAVRHLGGQNIFRAGAKNEGHLVIRHLDPKPCRAVHFNKTWPVETVTKRDSRHALVVQLNGDFDIFRQLVDHRVAGIKKRVVLTGTASGTELEIDRRQLVGQDIDIAKLLFCLGHQAFTIICDQG